MRTCWLFLASDHKYRVDAIVCECVNMGSLTPLTRGCVTRKRGERDSTRRDGHILNDPLLHIYIIYIVVLLSFTPNILVVQEITCPCQSTIYLPSPMLPQVDHTEPMSKTPLIMNFRVYTTVFTDHMSRTIDSRERQKARTPRRTRHTVPYFPLAQ